MIGKALITGGAGFIGAHLVERLVDEGTETLVIDNLSTGRLERLAQARRVGGVRVHQLDIRAPELEEAAKIFKPEVVFHLAAQAQVPASVHDPMEDASVNVLGTINVLSAAVASGARRVVFASTGGALYGSAKKLPATEKTARNPESPYGISKKIVEDYFRYFEDAYGLDYVIVAPANVYGPGQDPFGEAGVVAIFAKAMIDGRRPVIYGDGSVTRDYVYVEDVVDAFVRAGNIGGGLLLNVGTSKETSTREIFDLLAKITGYHGEPKFDPPRPGDVPRSCLSAAAARKHLGWEPFTPLTTGLRRTVDAMRGR
jgi:nucleoside-diphosphate-sugar epimerase